MNRKTKVIIPLAALIMAICVLSIKFVSSNSVTLEDNSSFDISSETGSSDNNTISIVSSSITKVTNSKE